MTRPYYKKWLFIYPDENRLERDLMHRARGDRHIVVETADSNEAKAMAKERSTPEFPQILVRQDDKCDVLWPRRKLSEGEWHEYPDLETVKVAAAMRGYPVEKVDVDVDAE